MKIRSKSKPESQHKRTNIIKVNPYENPENIMSLMAKISSATPSADTSLFWNIVNDAYNFNKKENGKCLAEYLEENRKTLFNFDFKYDLDKYCRDLSQSLETRENTEHIQIVVAGGFSSGKSSFLNRLTDSVNLLPTGVEPVSVVKTYLYCSRKIAYVKVKGVNQKNALINLNTGVLQAIQHAHKSNLYLASVLDKLFVEIPSDNLHGLAFIDTPGYNNSDKANKSNGKTDKETAIEALSEGNVLFWLIDCERGTTVSDDIEMIKKFNGKKLFIFNKADKKGETESKDIVESAAITIYREFPQEDIIDIIAYSTLDNKIYYSKNNNRTLTQIINIIKKSENGISEVDRIKDEIGILFEDEIEASKNLIENINEEYEENVKIKKEAFEYYNNAKKYKDCIIDQLKIVLIDSYNEILKASDNITNASIYALDSFQEFYDGVMNFENNDHWGSSSILNRAISKASEKYDEAVNRHNTAIEYSYYNDKYRNELIESISKEEDEIIEKYKEFYDTACQNCDDNLNRICHEKHLIEDMKEYQNIFMNAIDMGIKIYRKNNNISFISSNDENNGQDIFNSIKKGDYKSFLHCFEDGVDITQSNSEGYNPLTWAVYYGNNEMVKFMLDHDADPSIMDQRGYNAFHTAVENQYQDLCKMLMEYEPELINTETNSGESVVELSKKRQFSQWIENEIYNMQ